MSTNGAYSTSIKDAISWEIPTEQAVTVFGLAGGLAGALGQILASRRLSAVSGSNISLKALAPAVLIGFVGTVAGSFLIPRE